MLLNISVNYAEVALNPINPTKLQPNILSKIPELGVAYEAHKNFTNMFVFLDQLLPNHLYYELRANLINAYIPPHHKRVAILHPIAPLFSGQHFIGPGGVGIVGYVFPIYRKMNFMPFIRLQVLSDTASVHNDGQGNEVTSINYLSYLGGKVLMEFTDAFSIHAQYFGGHQTSVLFGKGIFESPVNPKLYAFVSTIEFDFPYKVTHAFKIMPYLQLNIAQINGDSWARMKPYNIHKLTNYDAVYAVRVAYQF